jgi:hypothetical protein
MKPTTMADMSRSRRRVVMRAMPDGFRIVDFTDLMVKLLITNRY